MGRKTIKKIAQQKVEYINKSNEEVMQAKKDEFRQKRKTEQQANNQHAPNEKSDLTEYKELKLKKARRQTNVYPEIPELYPDLQDDIL